MDFLQSHLNFLATHPFSVVFWGAFLATESDLLRLILVGSAGALLGDHCPYLAGRLAGTRVLGLYCKLTLASDRCVENTLQYFARFGSAALLLSRFSTSIRIFASACAGCGHITYPPFLALDAIGTVAYTTLCVLVGHLIGERAVVFFTTDRRCWLFLGLVVLAAATLLGYRLWRRLRYGRALASKVATVAG